MAGFTLTAIALALAAGGTAAEAIGKYKSGQAGQRAGQAAADISNSEADVADFNAHVAGLQSADAVSRGAEQENRFRDQVKGVIGRQRTQFAAGNIDVGFGSPVDVGADAAQLGELDALTIRTNAAREAWGYDVQRYNYEQTARIDRKAAANQILAGNEAASAGKWAAGTSIVSGAGSLLLAKYGFDKGGKK